MINKPNIQDEEIRDDFKTRVLERNTSPNMGLPIELSDIRRAINAPPHEEETVIAQIGIEACEIVEDKYGKSIFYKKLAHYHKRDNIILPYPHVRNVQSVHVQDGRKWNKIWDEVSVSESNDVEILYSIERIGDALVKINKNWRDYQRVRVIYEVGYKINDASYSITENAISNKRAHCMDPTLKRLIFAHCKEIYENNYKYNTNEKCKHQNKNKLYDAYLYSKVII